MELVYAQHNLAVLDLRYGDVDEAAAIFEDQIAQLHRLDCPEPRCEHIRVELADAVTWQGLTALARGRLEEARGFFVVARERVAALLETAPGDRSLEYELADETGNVAITDWWLGRLDDAHEGFKESLDILRTLTRHDPANLDWGYLEAATSLNLAESWLVRGQPARAQPLMSTATDILDSILAEAPSSRDAQLTRARAHLLAARLLAARSEPGRARAEAEQARLRLQEAVELGARGTRVVGGQATTLVLLGEIETALGTTTAADDHWGTAIDMLNPYLERSLHPRLAEPFVRAHLLTGQDDAPAVSRVRATGLATPGLWPEPIE